MATDTSYFTSAEQGWMNDTTVTTRDTKNSAPIPPQTSCMHYRENIMMTINCGQEAVTVQYLP